jgi:hypothetical protein
MVITFSLLQLKASPEDEKNTSNLGGLKKVKYGRFNFFQWPTMPLTSTNHISILLQSTFSLEKCCKVQRSEKMCKKKKKKNGAMLPGNYILKRN